MPKYKYSVLWKEKRPTAKSFRPEWVTFTAQKRASQFAELVKKDKLTKNVRIPNSSA